MSGSDLLEELGWPDSSMVRPEDATSLVGQDQSTAVGTVEPDMEPEGTVGGQQGAPSAEGHRKQQRKKPVVQPSHESVHALKSYQIRPPLEDKFKSTPVREIIHATLTEALSGKAYESENAKIWTISIANLINGKVRDMKMKRYKHVVQVTVGEKRGAGVKTGLRCLWDSETDGYASDTFINDSIFAVAVVFGVYLY